MKFTSDSSLAMRESASRGWTGRSPDWRRVECGARWKSNVESCHRFEPASRPAPVLDRLNREIEEARARLRPVDDCDEELRRLQRLAATLIDARINASVAETNHAIDVAVANARRLLGRK